MADADPKNSQSSSSKSSPTAPTEPVGDGGTTRFKTGRSLTRLWVGLCAALLIVTTPVALLQLNRELDFPFLHLPKSYSFLEPYIVPPNSQLSYIGANIRSVSHSDLVLWVGGDSGLLAYSKDDAQSWNCLSLQVGVGWFPSNCHSGAPEKSFQANDALLGTLFAQTELDVARQYIRTAESGKEPSVIAIQWLSVKSAVLVAASGIVYKTEDSGQSWRPVPLALLSPSSTELHALTKFPNLSSIEALGRWRKAVATLFGTAAQNDNTFVVAGQRLSYQNLGVLTIEEPKTFPSCTDVAKRILGQTTDKSFVQADPTCIINPAPLRAWFLDTNNPHLLKVIDEDHLNGLPITASAAHSVGEQSFRLPAPWYLFVTLPIAIALILLAWREQFHKLPVPPRPQSIANMGVADHPLQWNDNDAMGFHALARGISLFLRNVNTGLPLVLAVNGRWGSGKSSLMNLLQINMQNTARTVWFNAWHHQSEDQLLAALLQAVRTQSLDQIWSFGGVVRRSRLFFGRLKRIWPIAILMSIATIALGWITWHLAHTLFTEPEPRNSTTLKQAIALISSGIALLGTLKTFRDAVGSLIANPASLLASSTSSASMKDLNEQTTFRERFSEDFKKLVDVLGSRRLVIIIDDLDRCPPEKIREIMEGINFLVSSGDCVVVLGLARLNVEQFLGYSFKDFAESLPLEMLELKPGENCIVEDKPRLYARLYLEKLIQIDVPIPSVTNDQARSIITRKAPLNLKQTAQYTGDPESNRILAVAKRLEERLRVGFRAIDHWAGPVLGSLIMLMLLAYPIRFSVRNIDKQIDNYLSVNSSKAPDGAASVTIGGINVGIEDKRVILSDEHTKPTDANQKQSGAPSVAATVPVAPPVQAADQTVIQSPPSTGTQPSAVQSPANPTIPTALRGDELQLNEARPVPEWMIACGLGLLLLGFSAILLRFSLVAVESLTVQDSPDFEKALVMWVPLIHYVFRSPRSLKRFLNKVRFLAMRQRGLSEPDPEPLLDRWSAAVARRYIKLFYPKITAGMEFNTRSQLNVEAPNAITEDELVVLVALEGDAVLWKAINNNKGNEVFPLPDSLDEPTTRAWLESNDHDILRQLKLIWPRLSVRLEQYANLAGSVTVI
jgi:KAP family P-loop domain